MFRPVSFVAFTSLLMFSGCAEVVDFADRVVEPAPQRARDEAPGQVRQPRRVNDVARDGAVRQRARRNVGNQDRASSSDTEQQENDRAMPGNDLPSQRPGWDREREMPSDSMPSNSGKWGKGRSMPSDSAFSRRSKDNSDSDSSDKPTEKSGE